ncbi:MAG TPA: acetate--CoA ligase [Steroidobacteraceae bacterium]
MANKHIESVLLEERSFPPPADFAASAGLKPADVQRLQQAAAANPTAFWADLAREQLSWQRPFSVVLDDADAPNYRWFSDGRLNVSFNCLDIHLAKRGNKTALVFEGEDGNSRRISYRELHAEVCRFANALKAQGVRHGDRVIIYMPLIPEVVVAMHACNRIGAIHSVVFGGFSAPALKDRIVDTEARLVITADGGWRGGHVVELKAATDKALASGCPSVERVIVFRRTGKPVPMEPGRDRWWHEVIEGQSDICEPEWVQSEHPLFLLYTSGSTGKPKGIQHSSGGYLLGAKLTTQWVFDLRDDDIFWCTADVGWVTGHSYVAYGPLALGATVVLYEGAPTTPDPGRLWKICQTHGVTIFYTAPTAIRALMKLGEEWPARYDLSRLRLLGTVGEPINPEAWMWYHRVIGQGRCPIVDTWWQTETGGIMISPLPGVTATKPGSCTRPLPGIEADIVDESGKPVTRPEAGGYLVIRKPWPFMLRTLWRDNDRYLAAYWEKFKKRYYVAGDSARRDKDGYFWIMGRIDDVLNVAGHRLGTMEIESALVSHPRVAEAAVVGKPHEIKGEAVFAYVVLRGQRPTGDTAALVQELRNWVAEQLGAIARPEEIRFADNLPKTRSGKIMRRLLRSIARGEEITQDVSTLENPAILDQLRGVDTGGPARIPASNKPPSSTRTGRAKGGAAAGVRHRKPAAKARVSSSKRAEAAHEPHEKGTAKAAARKAGAVKKTVARKAGVTIKTRAKKTPARKTGATRKSRARPTGVANKAHVRKTGAAKMARVRKTGVARRTAAARKASRRRGKRT